MRAARETRWTKGRPTTPTLTLYGKVPAGSGACSRNAIPSVPSPSGSEPSSLVPCSEGAGDPEVEQ